MSWDVSEFFPVSMGMRAAFKVTAGCEWTYLCSKIYHGLGNVWFENECFSHRVSMHLANKTCVEHLPDLSQMGISNHLLLQSRLSIYMKEPRNIHSEVREKASLKKCSYRCLGFNTFEIWVLFGRIFQKSSSLSSLRPIQDVSWTPQAEEGKRWAGSLKASCFALNRRCLERPFQ